jgi:2'-5' RNA ligase
MPAGLDALWTGIEAGLRSNGVAIGEPAPRVAHVTILRDADRPLAPARIESIVWPVCEFVLIDSLLGPEPTYTILSRWPLAA